jgi:hypothetical protein
MVTATPSAPAPLPESAFHGDEALGIVARLRGLDVEQDGNVIVVRPAGPHAAARDQARAQPEFAAMRAISDP